MEQQTQCIICIGSNMGADSNIHIAVKSLASMFPDISFGNPVITSAEGVTASSTTPPYTNIAATFTTTMSPDDIKQLFKQIEKECGRTTLSKQSGLMPLDIDLLVYGKNVLKPSDMKSSYVLKALSTIE